MKNNVISWMTIMLMAFVCVGFAACGGDDDDNTTEIIDNNGGSDSGEMPVKDELTPGIYFSIDLMGLHQYCSDLEALGDYIKITKVVKEYGADASAWKVEKGDMIGEMYVHASLKYPTGSGELVVSQQTYHTTTVYYYVKENEKCEMMPWSEFRDSYISYSNGQFTYQFLGETYYFKKVK